VDKTSSLETMLAAAAGLGKYRFQLQAMMTDILTYTMATGCPGKVLEQGRLMEIAAGIIFGTALVLTSLCINRLILGSKLRIDFYGLALTASSVLLLAVIGESLINPLYELWFGSKLWEYRILPLHDQNVSALGLIVWTAYGIHLYFAKQTLEAKLPPRWNTPFGIAFIIGFEAPFVFEILGNLIFLRLLGDYYAYYLPSDVYHLTSFQVIPIYMLCVYIGLLILDYLTRQPRRITLPPAIFGAGIVYVLAG